MFAHGQFLIQRPIFKANKKNKRNYQPILLQQKLTSEYNEWQIRLDMEALKGFQIETVSGLYSLFANMYLNNIRKFQTLSGQTYVYISKHGNPVQNKLLAISVGFLSIKMNSKKLQTCFESVAYAGNTLSSDQWIVLNNSLTVLQSENHFENVYLWGLILGQEGDYYIAYGYEKDALFGRKFYYSTNMLDWGVLPTADDTSKRLTEICFQRFQGDPALVLEVADDDPGPSPEEMEKKRQEICLAGGDPADIMEEFNFGVAQLKEEDRLAATVEFINHEAVAVPRGVLIKQPEGQVEINRAFEGLPYEESDELTSYVHYRKPVQKWNTNLVTRKDYNYALDFLDPINLDLPKGCWNIQQEKGGRLFTLKNLYWPGFISYHWCDTPDWGYLYYGNGRKDLDVPFMLYS